MWKSVHRKGPLEAPYSVVKPKTAAFHEGFIVATQSRRSRSRLGLLSFLASHSREGEYTNLPSVFMSIIHVSYTRVPSINKLFVESHRFTDRPEGFSATFFFDHQLGNPNQQKCWVWNLKRIGIRIVHGEPFALLSSSDELQSKVARLNHCRV